MTHQEKLEEILNKVQARKYKQFQKMTEEEQKQQRIHETGLLRKLGEVEEKRKRVEAAKKSREKQGN